MYGAFAFGFSTYLLIILQVGHNTKALAVSFFPFVIGGLLLLFRKQFFWGFLLSSLALGMQVRANHYQMTYYLFLLIGVFVLVWGVQAFREKQGKSFLRSFGLFVVAGIIALGLNASPLLATAEYAKFSTRGSSELKLRADGSPKEQSSGLDYDYITEYSYGIFESLNLIVPRIQGGGSSEDLGKGHGVYEFLISNGVRPSQASQFSANVPTYWGSQPILEAPAYLGISVFFFALLALFYVRTPLRNALAIGIVFSLLLSWGKNISFLTQFFIDYVPFYNKFRAVSSIQVVLEFCFPVLAVLGLQWSLNREEVFDLKKFSKVVAIPVAILIVLLLLKGTFSFVGVNDAYLTEIYGSELMSLIKGARRSIYQEDLIRGLLIILVLTALVVSYQLKKVKKNTILLLCLGVLLFDLLGVSTRYISRNNFVPPSRVKSPFQITDADRAILQDNSRYRVFEPQLGLTGARTAFYHNSLGGYHGAKPRRFEELFDYYNTHQISGILDILNVKYVLVTNSEDNALQPLSNPNALGPAWTVQHLKIAPSADALLNELKTTDFKTEAWVLEQNLPKNFPLEYEKDSLSSVVLSKSAPDELIYQVQSQFSQFVVFSEMYYPKGWTATVNEDVVPIINVNYVLRGLNVPPGKSTIVFRFDPPVVVLGTRIRWLSMLLFLLILGGIYYIQSSEKRNRS